MTHLKIINNSFKMKHTNRYCYTLQ